MGIKYIHDESVPEGNVKVEFNQRFNGQRKQTTVTCRESNVDREYQKWADKMETETATGTDTSKRTLFETIDEYLEYYRTLVNSRGTINTLKDKERVLRRFAETAAPRKLRDIKRKHIMEYKQHRFAGGVRVRTVNCDIAYLSHFINWSRHRDYFIGNNPAEGMKEKEDNIRIILLTSEQTDELFEKAKGDIYTAVALAVHAGLRKQEILNLEWKDIDFSSSQIHVRPENSKGSKSRIVPLTSDLSEHLYDMRKQSLHHTRVFENWTTNHRFRKPWELLRDKLSFRELADGKVLHFHDLRHCFAVKLRQHGVALDRISVYMGHESVKVTERYYANVPVLETAQEDMKVLNNVVPLKKKQTSSQVAG